MRKILSGVIAAGFVATVGLSAQEPPPISAPGAPGGAQRSTPSSQSTSGQSKTVTLSGCIQNAPAASASASAAGAQASASTSPKFVLSTKGAAGAGASASSTVGTSGSETRYQLQGDEKTISPHLNHQVEITGTVESSAAGGPGAGAGAAAGAGAGASASGPMLKVESVKMVSATCS